jgi:hypothetical protein
MTDDSLHADWAKHLTDDRLASDLRRLADNIRFDNPEARAARLREAARRLDGARPAQQTLVTLADGHQVAFMHGQILARTVIGGLWPMSLEPSNTPHVPNTFYVGEW